MITSRNTDDYRYRCRVCGWKEVFPPWGKSGKISSHAICYCCRVEWGYEDHYLESTRAYRQKWLDGGAKWWSTREKQPPDLNLEEQMKHIPPDYM